MTNWPDWWSWELGAGVQPARLKRMIDRGFTETDLRTMMEAAVGVRRDAEPGRWFVEASHESRPGHVIVEPDTIDKLVVVITAFSVEAP